MRAVGRGIEGNDAHPHDTPIRPAFANFLIDRDRRESRQIHSLENAPRGEFRDVRFLRERARPTTDIFALGQAHEIREPAIQIVVEREARGNAVIGAGYLRVA